MYTSIISKPNGVRALSLLSGLFLLVGCVSERRNVSHEAGYQQLVSGSYQTRVDLYLVMAKHADCPELAINDGRDGFRDMTLPRTVDRQEIGRKLPNGVILDIVPPGARFTVRSVMHDSSPEGVRVWFEGELSYPGKHLPRVSSLFIQSSADGRDGRRPTIDATLAERIK